VVTLGAVPYMEFVEATMSSHSEYMAMTSASGFELPLSGHSKPPVLHYRTPCKAIFQSIGLCKRT